MSRIRQHHDTDAEASVLGGILLHPALIGKLADLEVEDFSTVRHQTIWSAMVNLADDGKPIDAITVAGEIARRGRATSIALTTAEIADAERGATEAEMHSMAYLASLQLRVPSVDNVLTYARTIQEHRGDRDARLTLNRCIVALDDPDRADDANMRGDAFVQWARLELGKLKLRGAQDTSMPIARVVEERVRDYEKIHAAKERGAPVMLGLPTGIEALDKQIGGYPIGIGTVIAGRPGAGKSSVMRAASDACSRAGIGTHTFSLEDLRARFADRVISSESRVPIETLRTGGDIKVADRGTLGPAIGRLYKRRHWLVDDSMMTATQIVARWRRRGEDNDTKLVVVDYLQRLRKSDSRMSDFDHVSEAMTVLCDATKDDKIACVIGSQLNRECEKREDKRPQLADLRAGGPIEELSKCVIGVYRGVMYGDATESDEFHGDDRDWQRRMELLILKHNDGAAPGRVFARWDGPTTTVS